MVDLKEDLDMVNKEDIISWTSMVFIFTFRSAGYIIGYTLCSVALSKFAFATFRSNCFFLAIIATALGTLPLHDTIWKVVCNLLIQRNFKQF